MLTTTSQSGGRLKSARATALETYGSQMGRLTEQRVYKVALTVAKQEAERRAEEASEAMRLAQAAAISLQAEMERRLSTEAMLSYVSSHDMLTGLTNRAELDSRIGKAIQTAPSGERQFALVSIGVDHFKTVNDSMGYSAGDSLLRQIGERLQTCVREGDVVARLGSDEFSVLHAAGGDADDVRNFADRVLVAFATPFVIGGDPVFITLSMGITFYPDDGTTIGQLQHNADFAMHRAKQRGGNGYQFFDLTLNEEVQRRAKLEQALRVALIRNELFLAYQPQVDVNTTRITGVEALARWIHPDFGPISPVEFIPLAERSGLIADIGSWVLREACSQAVRWRTLGLPPITMAVNLSVPQIQEGDVTREVWEVLRDTGLPPEQLELEITESGVMSDLRDNAAILGDLRELGVALAIDDFGTGYSSLSYLRSLPVHRIKIDRSFVTDVTHDQDAAAIASTIVTLARNLRLDVTAEGVETEGHDAFVRAINCTSAQGYFYGRPVRENELTKLLARS